MTQAEHKAMELGVKMRDKLKKAFYLRPKSTHEAQSTDMLVVDGWCTVADHQYQHWRAEEEDDSKVKVVDSAHYERTVGWENTAAVAEPELRHHATEADRQPTH